MVGPQSRSRTDDVLLDVHDFYGMYWDEPKLLLLEELQAMRLGFSSLDSKIISNVGIPKWAAPSLVFGDLEVLDGNKILMGEDGGGRPIFYRTVDRNVHVLGEGGVKSIAIGLDGLIFTLVMYAAMVELAIGVNRDAFRANNIPHFLVDKFRDIYCSEYAEIYDGSFIEEEVLRLGSGSG